MDVIGMGMGVDQGGDAGDAGGQALIAQVGACVEQHLFAGGFEEDAAAAAAVARIANGRQRSRIRSADAGTRAASQNGNSHAGRSALLIRRKKLSVVSVSTRQ
ncbi:MAG: hypothetical protein R3D03_14125 [Geminicoccaceae bacterium]